MGSWFRDHLRAGGSFHKPSLERGFDMEGGLSGQNPMISDIWFGCRRGKEGAQYFLSSRPSEPCGFSFCTVCALG